MANKMPARDLVSEQWLGVPVDIVIQFPVSGLVGQEEGSHSTNNEVAAGHDKERKHRPVDQRSIHKLRR